MKRFVPLTFEGSFLAGAEIHSNPNLEGETS